MNCGKKLLASLLLSPLALIASEEEVLDRWYTGVSGAMLLPGGGSSLERAGGVSAHLGYFLSDSFALELDLISIPNAVSSHGGNSTLTGFGIQGAWHFMGFERLDPFLTFGASSLFSSHHVFADDSHRTAFGPTFGLGFLYHLTDNLALRADSKAMVTLDTPSEIAFTISGGLQWSFGGGEANEDSRELIKPPSETVITVSDENDKKIKDAVKSIKKDYSILVRGHIDCKLGMGRERAHKLSIEKAEKVKSALTSSGIDEAKIKVEGAGFSNPIKPFNFALGTPENNRVEIIIREVD
jgi:hypothetical protein